jgi:hypothetical protein
MRIALAALALSLTFAPSATAAPQSLARIPELESFALAGDAVLLTRATGRSVRVERLPLTPGVPRSTVFRRRSAGFGAVATVGASDELAAVAVHSADRRTGDLVAEEFAGPLLGPWTALGAPRTLRRRRFVPAYHEVDGSRLFSAEISLTARPLRWVVREPGAQPRTLPPPRGAFLSAAAGDFVAYGSSADVIVENWRTGARIARYPFADEVQSLDVRADGALVTADSRGNVVVRRPGIAPRRITRRGIGPSFAGDRIVFIARAGQEGVVQLQVAEPDGRVRRFGVPSADLEAFVVDEDRVLWRGSGCLLTAPITDPAAAAPDAGACPRSEVFLSAEISSRVKRDRRVRIPLDCIAAAPPACRGTLTLSSFFRGGRLAKPMRFRIPVGVRARLNVRLTRRGYRALVRAGRRFGAGSVDVRTVTVDPDGRRRVQRHAYVINVR